jgi:cytoskeleton protein RodZ
MSTSDFGDHLRRERELRGVTLEEVSAATRISVTFLEALERGDWEKLPGGVFRRGFIRSVARFLGLDEENLIGEYSLETNDAPKIAVPARNTRPDLRHAYFYGGIAAIVVFIVIAIFAYRHFSHRRISPDYRSVPARTAPRPASNAIPPVANSSAAAAPIANSAANLNSSAATSPASPPAGSAQNNSAPSNSPAPPQSPPQNAAGNSAAKNAAGNSGPAHSPTAVAPNAGAPSAASPVAAGFPPATSKTTTGPAGPSTGLVLRVQASRAAHVRVLSDGEELFNGEMGRGQWQNFRGVQNIEIFSDDAGAVQLQLNGQPVKSSSAAGQPLHLAFPSGGEGNSPDAH